MGLWELCGTSQGCSTPAGASGRDFQQGPPVSRASAEVGPCQPSRAGVLAPRPGALCGTEEMSPLKWEMGFLCCLSPHQ